MPLTPKTFDLLCYLVSHAGQLVTKDDLLEALWPETTVSEAVLQVRINELRKVLGGVAQAPQFIATVRRRGYCFIAPVTAISQPEQRTTVPPAPVPVASARPAFQTTHRAPGALMEREAELQQLHACLDRVRHGVRQVVFVSGEAGIGKTSVIEAFLAQAMADRTLWLARGQCIERCRSHAALDCVREEERR